MNLFNNTPQMFYGQKRKSKLVPAVSKYAHFMKNLSVPSNSLQEDNILGESQIWKVFHRQIEAIEYATNLGMDLMVFSFESKAIGEGGKRNFVVAHPKRMWNILRRRPTSDCCSYEVIPEGHICKLYFDLEFYKELNPNSNGQKMVQTFITVVNFYLKKEFDVVSGIEDVMILDSTTNKKFSRHLIYNSKIAFTNNFHAGNFVIYVCEQLKIMRLTDKSVLPNSSFKIEDIGKLYVINNNAEIVLFCDLGVYTKNRNFRTYYSTKYAKQSPLVLSSDNQYNSAKGSNDENVFLDSLLTYVPKTIKILEYKAEIQSCIKQPNLKSVPLNIANECSLSPFPQIDTFIINLLGEGTIRSWQYYNDDILVFNISKSHRFCYKIQREHKSNGVIYVVNMKKRIYYQKCLDPDCKNFKSNDFILPPHILFSEDEEEEFLLEAVVDAENMMQIYDESKENQLSGGYRQNAEEVEHAIPNQNCDELIQKDLANGLDHDV